jgi:hypothetical protein
VQLIILAPPRRVFIEEAEIPWRGLMPDAPPLMPVEVIERNPT